MSPVDASVNDTASGVSPLVGVAVKSATGAATGAVTSTQLKHVATSLPPGPATVSVTS